MDFEMEASEGFPWDKVNAAKRYLYAVKPWWARFGEHLTIVPVYQPPTGNQPYGSTMSTDRQFRLYIDRGYAVAKPVHILAGAIEHQFQHHTRNTFSRLRYLSDEDWAEFATISFNLEINGGMDAEQLALKMDQVRIACETSKVFSARELDSWNIEAPPGMDDEGWIPRLIPLPDGLSAEEYFSILKRSKEEQEKREREEQERQEQDEQQEQEEDQPLPPESESDEQDTDQDSEDQDSSDQSDSGGPDEQEPEGADDSEDGDASGGEEPDSEGGEGEGSDEDESASGEDGPEGEGADPEGSPDSSGSPTSDDPSSEGEEGESGANEADNGAEDLSDGGESDGSEDNFPEPEESDAKDGGSAGGNHSSQEKGQEQSDSKGETGNASQPSQDSGDPTEAPDGAEAQEGDAGEGTETTGEPGDGRAQPSAEIADAIEALRDKLDPRLWAMEMENPGDDLTSHPWKPDDRDNEPPVPRTEITEAMIELEDDVENSARAGFGLSPGGNLLEWVYRQRKIRGVDWESRFTKLVSSGFTSAKVSGASDLSYTVRNPNQPEFGVILQGLHDYAPSIMVIMDVSASMRYKERQSIAMSAFDNLCRSVLGRFGTKVTWVSVDTDVVDVGEASGWNKHLHRKMSYGFGGTKIGAVIERVMKGELKWKNKKYPAPDLLIIATDCAFTWPKVRPSRKGKIVVASVETDVKDINYYLPDWLNRKRELVIMR